MQDLILVKLKSQLCLISYIFPVLNGIYLGIISFRCLRNQIEPCAIIYPTL